MARANDHWYVSTILGCSALEKITIFLEQAAFHHMLRIYEEHINSRGS